MVPALSCYCPRNCVVADQRDCSWSGASLVQGLIDTVSVVIFGLWMPTMALALAAARGTADQALE